jgi:tetratricopeptide (TPR) repeat protein
MPESTVIPTARTKWARFAPPLLIAAIVLVYWLGLGGGYAFDDFPNIVDNKALHVASSHWRDWNAAIFSSPATDLQRPLAMLSFAANYAATGLDPWGMKFTNLLIHCLNALLVFGLVRQLLISIGEREPMSLVRRDFVALFIAAAWALNPINLMGVLFIVQRMESLCHVFVFAGLWIYLVGRQRQLRGAPRGMALVLAGLLAGTTLGVLAKESAVLLPVYALTIEVVLLRFKTTQQRTSKALLWTYAFVLFLPAVLGSLWLLPKILVPEAWAVRDFTLADRLMTETRVVLDYARWTYLPQLGELSLYHDDYVPSRGFWQPPSTVFCVLGIAMLAPAGWLLRRRRILSSLGIFWFLGAQLLTATLIPLELVFEHRNYFASLGLMLTLADALLLAPTSHWRKAACFGAVCLLAMYAFTTHLRAREWSDPVRFAISEAAKHPHSPRATYDEARTFIMLSDYRADSPFTAKALAALERARAAPHGSILAEQATLIFAARTGRPLQHEWWEAMWKKLDTRSPGPQDTSSLGSLNDCELHGECHFPREDMIQTFVRALRHGPNAEVLTIYGDYALNTLHDAELALRLWREAAQTSPGEASYHASLAKLYMASGAYAEAREEIERIRRLRRLGNNETLARELDDRLNQTISTKAPRRLDTEPAKDAQ